MDGYSQWGAPGHLQVDGSLRQPLGLIYVGFETLGTDPEAQRGMAARVGPTHRRDVNLPVGIPGEALGFGRVRRP